ncbi:hypothetical protein V492_03216, partial [Pseudogymnoascus sp. VKM F-4246]
ATTEIVCAGDVGGGTGEDRAASTSGAGRRWKGCDAAICDAGVAISAALAAEGVGTFVEGGGGTGARTAGGEDTNIGVTAGGRGRWSGYGGRSGGGAARGSGGGTVDGGGGIAVVECGICALIR